MSEGRKMKGGGASREEIGRFGVYLKGRGLKDTPGRRAVAVAALNLRGHFDPEALQAHLRRRGTRVSRATIYRTLDHLIGSGLVRKTSLDTGQKMAFYENTLDREHHEHMICLRCHRVIEFSSEEIERLQDAICDRHRFRPVRHTHQIMGYCSRCA